MDSIPPVRQLRKNALMLTLATDGAIRGAGEPNGTTSISAAVRFNLIQPPSFDR
jgi:hypothetical protein